MSDTKKLCSELFYVVCAITFHWVGEEGMEFEYRSGNDL